VRWIPVLFVLAARLAAQQGMGSSTKAVPRSSPKASAAVSPPAIDLRDVAADFGITAPNFYGGERAKKHILEMTGNGVALLDYNNDGKLDVLLINGARLDGSSRASVLYKNLGSGKFADATREAGLLTTGWAQGVCAGDFDNDGFTDLLVTRYGDNLLFKNENGRFRALPFPSTPELFNTGCTFLDYDRDGLLDVFVSNYVSFPLSQVRRASAIDPCNWLGIKVFCGPRGFPSGANHLFHNEGDGRFRDVSASSGIRLSGLHYGLGVTSADFDDDGWPDIYVACDSTPSIFYRNNHDGTFSDMAVPTGVAYGENGEEQGGMGVAAADYDNDGKIDILRTNFIDETTATLYRNLGELFFSDETVASGLAINTKYVAWGTQFVDIDQDGYKDLIVANGHIYPELARGGTSQPFEMPRLLYWNLRNGAFRDVTKHSGAALAAARSSRGLVAGDLDGDGTPEIVIVNMNAPPSVLKNYGEKGASILVKLIGVKSNRSAIGAKIVVSAGASTQTAFVSSGSSYLSQSDFRQHFGLGKATQADRIEILWPGGGRDSLANVAANQEIHVREGEGIVARIAYAH
jgi:hypothetical protein